MKKSLKSVFLLALMVFACNKVPVTGRNPVILISDDEMHAMSFQSYDEFLKENKLSDDQQKTQMVKTVGANIQKAVEQYMAEHNLSKQIEGFEWEFNLVEDEQINAWCMPGGKVVFYTGILPVCQDEAGIAVVMGHEVAHAIARHGAERMTTQMTTQLGLTALSVALSEKPEQTQNMFMAAAGVGAQVGVLLPFSRKNESEADRLGLIFMAMAGYDPEEAPKFWQRMSSGSQGAPPEFLSTHPSHDTRIADLKKWMPEALTYYKQK